MLNVSNKQKTSTHFKFANNLESTKKYGNTMVFSVRNNRGPSKECRKVKGETGIAVSEGS